MLYRSRRLKAPSSRPSPVAPFRLWSRVARNPADRDMSSGDGEGRTGHGARIPKGRAPFVHPAPTPSTSCTVHISRLLQHPHMPIAAPSPCLAPGCTSRERASWLDCWEWCCGCIAHAFLGVFLPKAQYWQSCPSIGVCCSINCHSPCTMLRSKRGHTGGRAGGRKGGRTGNSRTDGRTDGRTPARQTRAHVGTTHGLTQGRPHGSSWICPGCGGHGAHFHKRATIGSCQLTLTPIDPRGQTRPRGNNLFQDQRRTFVPSSRARLWVKMDQRTPRLPGIRGIVLHGASCPFISLALKGRGRAPLREDVLCTSCLRTGFPGNYELLKYLDAQKRKIIKTVFFLTL